MYVILVYDISIDSGGQKVLRNVFKICKKYLIHIQNSTFEGELAPSQIFQLKNELKKHIRKDKDSVIVFKSRSKKWLDKEFWGKEEDVTSVFI